MAPLSLVFFRKTKRRGLLLVPFTPLAPFIFFLRPQARGGIINTRAAITYNL